MDANQHEESRKAQSEGNGGSAYGQPGNHMGHGKRGVKVQFHHCGFEAAELQQAGKTRARCGEEVSGESDGHQSSANHPTDRPVGRPTLHRTKTRPAAELCAPLPDAAHEDLSGPALRRILHREHAVFGNQDYERLAQISVSHIYNLRQSDVYRSRRVRVQCTQSRQIPIGERRKPDPKGKPGYLRVDTVHQGTHDGKMGVFHINAVDTVAQWQVVGCVETISERHMIPVLEALLHQFPFRILGFHCDNGAEFINQNVARLLEKLLVEFTKSRAYRTTDNALVEGKNGAVIRKGIGYGFIAASHADQLQRFFTAHFNPYLNFHRPCGYAVLQKSTRGKVKRTYPANDYRTPFEKLSSLPRWQQYLKPDLSESLLRQQAHRLSDTEAAKRMQKAKIDLLKRVRNLS
jgi:hypothetical protein